MSVGGDSVFSERFNHRQDLAFQVLPSQEVATLLIDHLPLFIHHVVIFQQVLADVEVVRFDSLLSIFNRASHQAVLDRLALLHPQAIHNFLDALSAKNTQQIVFEREIEPRRAWVSLASRPATELVVNPSSLVPFSAENMESTRGHNFLTLFHT